MSRRCHRPAVLKPQSQVIIAALLSLAATDGTPGLGGANVAALLGRLGVQAGGPSGFLEEKAVDQRHSVVLLYDNENPDDNEHGRDTHVVAVIERATRRPVLTLAELPPEAGYDTCRTLRRATTGSVVIATWRCDYGGESKIKLGFDLKSRTVTSEKFGQDVPIDPTTD